MRESSRLMSEYDRLASRVYVGLRDGVVDPEAAFDLAGYLMDWQPSSEAVRDLAEQSVAGADPAGLADAAGRVLEESGFEPGFDAEPRLLEALDQALKAIRADLRATGLGDDPVQLGFVDQSCGQHAFAEFRGSFGHSSGIAPGEGRDRVTALVAVADDLQDAIMSSLTSAWPVCPVHHFGGHPREHADQAVWWCNGGDRGHIIALIGQWRR